MEKALPLSMKLCCYPPNIFWYFNNTHECITWNPANSSLITEHSKHWYTSRMLRKDYRSDFYNRCRERTIGMTCLMHVVKGLYEWLLQCMWWKDYRSDFYNACGERTIGVLLQCMWWKDYRSDFYNACGERTIGVTFTIHVMKVPWSDFYNGCGERTIVY